MKNSTGTTQRIGGLLSDQLAWFIRLRWLAALAVVIGALVDAQWLGLSDRPVPLLLLGLTVGGYNALLWWIMRRLPPRGMLRRQRLLLLAWAQVLLDLAFLTLLAVWTGGIHSPVSTFYVFHMVFASLLLPRRMGYTAAVLAASLFCASLLMTGQWPQDRQGLLMLLGLVITLLFTVFLANHLTQAMRAQRGRLIRQNRRIRDMTNQLRQQQQAMIQHEKMVAMGHMAAGVTHEIANPLASMDSLLQLMQRKPERMNEASLLTLREQISRITSIIAQMKAFARPADMRRQQVPLNELVEQALGMLRFDKRLGRIRVIREYDPDAGEVSVLPQAIEQVLVNLIHNAMDAMGGVTDPQLQLRTQRLDDQCLIEVADNGHGISPADFGRLFEPFFTTKPVGQGTGLGLSISYSLVQRMGGSISVRSQPGQGATFSVRLPATRPSREREGSAEPVAATENSTH